MRCSRSYCALCIAVPNAVQGLSLVARTRQSLTVTWNVSTEGSFSGYVVTLDGGDISTKETLGKDITTKQFIGLATGTKYIIRVVTTSGDQKSSKREGYFMTGWYYTLYFHIHHVPAWQIPSCDIKMAAWRRFFRRIFTYVCSNVCARRCYVAVVMQFTY